MTNPRFKLYAAAALAIIVLTLTGAWYLWKPAPKVPEAAAPEQRQADDSLVLAKVPDRNAKPAHKIPKGTKLERTTTVTVTPTAGPTPDGKCPDVTVDLSLVRNPDHTRRVIASSPDGRITKGIDIPVEDAEPPPKEKLWAVGVTMDPFRVGTDSVKSLGAFLDRDVGPWRTGAQIHQVKVRGADGWGAQVKVGIRF